MNASKTRNISFRNSESPEHAGSDLRKDSGGGFKPYPAYKDSGVEWLGEVPVGWIAGKIKNRYTVTLGKMLQPTKKAESDKWCLYLRAANVTWSGVSLDDRKLMWFSPSERLSLSLMSNDLLVSEGGDVGRSCILNEDLKGCYFQNSINRIRSSEKSSTKFLYYWIITIKEAGLIDIVCNKSTIAHFTAEKVNETPMIFPPLPEQEKIAGFLDFETGRMDVLIQKQERLIELLKEKRQAVISHAVTKGLDPDVPMRDSGIEWLGEVPAHWKVVATSRISDLTTGNKDTQDAKPEGRYPFFVRSQTIEASDTYSYDGEGVLTSGDGAGVGKIFHYFAGRFEYHQRVYLFHNFRNVTGKYFFYYFREHLAIVALAGNAKSTVDSLRRPMLREFPVCVPPLNEQDEIVEYLEKQTDRFDLALHTAERAIVLIRERRTALISAAVTGKIDVREWEPKAVYSEASQPEELRMVAEAGVGYGE